jgi:hypothetical protein
MALADFFTRPSSEAPTEGGLSPDLADRLEQAKAAYLKQYGKPLPITSGFRTKEEQQRLFDQRKNNPNLVAKPGTSLHETGNAVDIGTSVPEAFLNQFGIHRPLGKKDPVHAVLMPVEKPSEGGLASFFTRPEGEEAPKEQDLTKPFIGYRPMRRAGVAEAQQAGSPEAQQASQERGKEVNFLRDLALGGASLADMTVGGILPMAGQVTQAGARFLGGAEQMLTGKPSSMTPQRAEEIGGVVTSALDKPFGKTLGAMGVGQGTESPAYKQELFRSTMDAFAQKGIEPTAEVIAQKTGMPIEDVRNMLGTAMIGVAPTVGKYGKKGLDVAREVASDVRSQMQQQFATKQGQPTAQTPSGMQSAGAAAAVPENVLRGNIDAAIAQSSPELQAHVQTLNPRAVNLPALETRSLEDKHGVNLSRGQRTGDTSLYSQEWNKRGETDTLGTHFNEQPKQFKAAFENSIRRNAPDIFETDPSSLGQIQINALAAKDAKRVQAIDTAYKDFRDQYVQSRQAAGLPVDKDFPVNGNEFLQKSNAALQDQLLQYDVPASIKGLLDDISKNDGNMTYNQFINLDKRLSAKTREGTGSERAAAYVIRNQLQDISLSPEAAALQPVYKIATGLAKERFDTIRSNPAYRAAINEAADLNELASTGESLKADKFHDKFVNKGTPESIRRMKAELADDPQALQAMTAGELRIAMRKAGLATDTPDLNPKQLANYIYDNKGRLQEALGAEGMKDLMEMAALSSKVGMPKTGTFNYSNSFSSMLGELAKQGLETGIESKLAAMTGGVSIPAVSLGKQWMGKLNKEGFAREATNPYGGLTRDLNNPQTPVKIDLRGMGNKE